MYCQVFKSSRKQDHYLFVPTDADTTTLPTTLLMLLGELLPVVEIELTPERELTNANTAEVITQLNTRGFYLQMPPSNKTPEDWSQ